MASGGTNDTRNDTKFHPRGYKRDLFRDADCVMYLCTICHHVLRNPIQSFCGHRFCQDCVEYVMRFDTQVICPACKTDDTHIGHAESLKLEQICPDRVVRKEMDVITVYCYFPGCRWSGMLKEYEGHAKTCTFVSIESEHIQKIEREEQIDSMDPCIQAQCPFQCGLLIDKMTLESHVKQFMSQHLVTIFKRIVDIEQLLGITKQTEGALAERIVNLEMIVKGQVTEETLHRSTASSQANRPTTTVQNEGFGLDVRLARAAPGPSPLQNVMAKQRIHEDIISIFNREIEHMTGKLDEMERHMFQDRAVMDETRLKMLSLERMMADKDVAFAELRLKVAELEWERDVQIPAQRRLDIARTAPEVAHRLTTNTYSTPLPTNLRTNSRSSENGGFGLDGIGGAGVGLGGSAGEHGMAASAMARAAGGNSASTGHAASTGSRKKARKKKKTVQTLDNPVVLASQLARGLPIQDSGLQCPVEESQKLACGHDRESTAATICVPCGHKLDCCNSCCQQFQCCPECKGPIQDTIFSA